MSNFKIVTTRFC